MISELSSSRRVELQKILTPKMIGQPKKISKNKVSNSSMEESFPNRNFIIRCFLIKEMKL